MNGYQAIPELLRRHGSTTVFGVLGSSNVGWIGRGVADGTIRLVKTRHEETAVSAAAGYSRVSGRLGVCSATRGPGFANSLNPLASAVHYHAPLLLIVGESPASRDRTTQDIDQRSLATTLGAGFHHAADGDELESRFWDTIAAVERDGTPQVLSIGDGVLEGEVPLEPDVPREPRPRPAATPDRIEAAVEALGAAKRPLIVAGQGALLAGCRADLERLAEATGAWLGTTINVNRFFAGHPAEIGLVGQSAPEITKALLRTCDVVLGVGASLNDYTLDAGRLFGDAAIVQVEADPEHPRRATDEGLHLVGDAAATTRALLAAWTARHPDPRPAPPAPPTFAELAAAVAAADIGHDPARGVDLRALYAAMDARLPSDRIVVTDAGRTRSTMAALIDTVDAHSWLDSRGYGSVGLGLGYAIGAATAAPDRKVVLFSGDVGFMMSSHDLDAIRLNDLDLTIVIRNDEQYGAERKYLAAVGLPPDLARQTLPDVPALARALGGDGVVIRDLDEVRDEHLAQRGLFILDVRLDPVTDWRPALDRARLPAGVPG